MKHGSDISLEIDGLILVHQNLPKRTVGQHRHKQHEIILPLAGRIKVSGSSGIKPLDAGRGEMVLIPAGMEHSYEVRGGDAEQIIILFPIDWCDSPPESISVLQHSILIAELTMLLLTAEKDFTLTPVLETLKLSTLRSIDTAKSFVAAKELRARIRDERLRKAVTYLEGNLAGEDLMTGAAVAAAASSRTLARLCKSDLGISMGDLLRTLRVDHAKKLLTAGNYSVTEVAFACGYSSMSQFISTFKAATGTLPSQYRRK